MEEADNSKKKEPGTWMSFLVFGIAIAIILTGVVILEFDVHIVLLLALIFVCVVSATLGYSFDDLVEFMKKSLGQAMSAMIIFIFIGVIIASWIFSGTVQTLIYYGLQYISPAVFLPVGLLLCCPSFCHERIHISVCFRESFFTVHHSRSGHFS